MDQSFKQGYITKDKQEIVKKHGVKYTDIKHSLTLFVLDYNLWKYGLTHNTIYSKSGNIFSDSEIQLNWKDIIPNSVMESVLKQILLDHNIKR